MSEEEKLQLENECLLKYSKAQMIQKYIDELEESIVLSDLWCKSQEENKRLNNIINELEQWLLEEHKKKQKWYNEQLSTNDKRYYEEKYLTSLTMINVFFDKIKELKGSDKE